MVKNVENTILLVLLILGSYFVLSALFPEYSSLLIEENKELQTLNKGLISLTLWVILSIFFKKRQKLLG